MHFLKFLNGFVDLYGFLWAVTWICGFVKIYTWISLSCYMRLSKLLHGLVKVVTWICQELFYVYNALCQKNQCWMSKSTQCLGSIVPLAMFSKLSIFHGKQTRPYLDCRQKLFFSLELATNLHDWTGLKLLEKLSTAKKQTELTRVTTLTFTTLFLLSVGNVLLKKLEEYLMIRGCS